MRYLYFYVITLLLFFASCNFSSKKEPLRVYNDRDGELPQTIRDFSFVDQDGNEVTNKTFEGKAYVSTYFFTSCPTICPKINKQMLRIYERFENDNRLAMISHSIDTKYDTVATLKRYATKLDIDSKKWHLITGDEKEIYDIAYDYFTTAIKEPGAPGGYDHDDLMVLVDKNRNIRAFCHALNAKEVDEFMDKIDVLFETEY